MPSSIMMDDSHITARVATRYVVGLRGTKPEDFERTVNACLLVHAKLQRYLGEFLAELRKAVAKSGDLPSGRVWSKYVSNLWNKPGGYATIHGKQFPALADLIDDIGRGLNVPDAANSIRHGLFIPEKLQIDAVLRTVQHHDFAPEGEGMNWSLSYDVGAVEKWCENLLAWSKQAEALVKLALKKGKQQLRRRGIG